ncbi:MAG TPA: TraR/DksA C4-type zinc finger protein [Noviherbaspirillum sp.]
MTSLPPSDVSEFEAMLRAERDNVLSDIRERLHASPDSNRMALLNHLETVGDWVEADLLNDTDIAMLSHELVRLRDIDGALARIKAGNYGVCMDCGEAIPNGRLAVLPTAQCCVRCQAAYEKQHGLVHNASL